MYSVQMCIHVLLWECIYSHRHYVILGVTLDVTYVLLDSCLQFNSDTRIILSMISPKIKAAVTPKFVDSSHVTRGLHVTTELMTHTRARKATLALW